MNRPVTAGALTRAALAIARTMNPGEALQAAIEDRASKAALDFLQTKAATPAGSLGNTTWGDEIANVDGAVPAMIESLRSMSFFYAMAAPGMANVYPMRTRVLASAAIPAPTDHAEAGFIPVLAGSFTAFSLAPRVNGGIVVLSDELIRASDMASFATVQRELQRAVVAAVDTEVLAELFDGVTPGTLSAAAPLTNLRAMLDAVNTTGTGRLIWGVAPNVANFLSSASLSGTGLLFPTMSPNGGTLLGVPAIVSDRLAAGRITLVDASGVAVNSGTIDVDRSQSAALQMADNPSGAANLVSLFQSNATALRIVAAYGCERIRSGAVAVSDLGA